MFHFNSHIPSITLVSLYKLSLVNVYLRFPSLHQTIYLQDLNIKWARIGYPIIEKEYDQSDAFLTEDVLTVIDSGEYNHVPMIIGYNDAEGISYLSSFEDINSMIPTDLNAEDDTDKANEIIAKINDFYFGDAEVPSNVAEAPSDVQEAIIKLYTDVYFSYPTYRTAMEHLKHVTEDESIYVYRFSADTKLNVYKLRNEYTAGFAGKSHGLLRTQ